jgi:hypothetical protein
MIEYNQFRLFFAESTMKAILRYTSMLVFGCNLIVNTHTKEQTTRLNNSDWRVSVEQKSLIDIFTKNLRPEIKSLETRPIHRSKPKRCDKNKNKEAKQKSNKQKFNKKQRPNKDMSHQQRRRHK